MHTRSFALPALLGGLCRGRRSRSSCANALHGLGDPTDLRKKRQVVGLVGWKALLHVLLRHLQTAALANDPRHRGAATG